jgi:hypothetical protein
LADAAAFSNVIEDRDDFVLRKACIEERSAFAFGEAVFTGLAAEQAAALGAVAHADGEVTVVACAIVRTFLVLATEGTEVVHNLATEKTMKRVDAVQFLL